MLYRCSMFYRRFSLLSNVTPVIRRQYILGSKMNSLESCFGDWIIQVCGQSVTFGFFSPDSTIIELAPPLPSPQHKRSS